MLPFMAEELQVILCTLLGCFIKEDLMATSTFKFPQDKISDEQNLFPAKRINIPFSVKDFGSELERKYYLPAGHFKQWMQLIHKNSHVEFAWMIISAILSGTLSDQHWRNIAQNPCAAISKLSILCRICFICISKFLINDKYPPEIQGFLWPSIHPSIHPSMSLLRLRYCPCTFDSTLVTMSQSITKVNSVVSGSEMIL